MPSDKVSALRHLESLHVELRRQNAKADCLPDQISQAEAAHKKDLLDSLEREKKNVIRRMAELEDEIANQRQKLVQWGHIQVEKIEDADIAISYLADSGLPIAPDETLDSRHCKKLHKKLVELKSEKEYGLKIEVLEEAPRI
ncbi:hypothetical protein CDL15_Pgr005557 [Punica granatum]|uniref:Uncharacterized protein n=1 Tax=Punica granatum TaxID=22663 RepID=A0A218WX32_PUNGR|nr:hypothetical protein CDL15_Pgr005557 [Punica granatum]PKI43938.1 hypothetical protein CRG98_035614 [Punica granatum]